MSKHIRIIGIGIFFLFALFSFAFCEEETFTITTYYPSPYGSYNELTTYSNTYLAINGGSVGIGTTNPNPRRPGLGLPVPKLRVVKNDGVGGPAIEVQNTYTGGGDSAIDFIDNSGNVRGNIAYYAQRGSGDPARFVINQGWIGEITPLNTVLNENGGSVGIGTASPNNKLQISGASSGETDVRIEVDANAINSRSMLKLISTDGAGNQNDWNIISNVGGDLTIYDDPGGPANPAYDVMRIQRKGAGGIGGGNVTITNLAGGGAVFADANGTLSLSPLPSDIRLKKNILPLSEKLNILEALKKLRGVYYNWNTSLERVKNLGEQREMGMIAQEVEPVLPELVGTDKEGYKTLNYPKLSAFIVEVCKEQQKEINFLKQEVTMLKAKLNIDNKNSQGGKK